MCTSLKAANVAKQLICVLDVSVDHNCKSALPVLCCKWSVVFNPLNSSVCSVSKFKETSVVILSFYNFKCWSAVESNSNVDLSFAVVLENDLKKVAACGDSAVLTRCSSSVRSVVANLWRSCGKLCCPEFIKFLYLLHCNIANS